MIPNPDPKPTVLVVDDEEHTVDSCRKILEAEGFEVLTAHRGGKALEILRARRPEILFADVRLPDLNGIELLRRARENDPDVVVILITGFASVESSVEAIGAGAYDYIPKPFTAAQLRILVDRAAREARLIRENRELKDQLRRFSPSDEMIGASRPMRAVFSLIQRVAPTPASVFISGESGTGKELVARSIHARSRRGERPFVAVNCAALPPSLLESELFGHEKGAFTGAASRKAGLLEHASSGTFFLDEICEMSLELQAKLLRVVQERRIRRVGGTEELPVDLRFIAATNRQPARAVEEGILRKDLYFRLNVVPVKVPPLRERRDDIPLLLSHFLRRYATRHLGPGAAPPRLTAGAINALCSYSWPGNVRELENIVERLVSLLEPGSHIGVDDLPPEVMAGPVGGIGGDSGGIADRPFHEAKSAAVAAFEKAYLRDLLTRHGGNVSAAAREAQVDRKTIHRLLNRHDLDANLFSSGDDGVRDEAG